MRHTPLGSARNRPVLKKLAFFCLILVFLVVAQSHYNILKYRFGILKINESLSFKALVTGASFLDAVWITMNSVGVLFDDHDIPVKSPLRTFHMKVEPGSIQAMASHLPESAKKRYYDARLLYPDGIWRRITYRFRGRNIWHWHPEKPSLRIRLRRSNPINLLRHINLVNPEDRAMVSNYFGEQLGRNMGVLTHRTEFARLFINNQFFGVYHMTTREDEEMLRLNRRVPGPIFGGDHLGRRWRTEEFEVNGDLDVLERINPIASLIEAMYMDQTPERYDRLWRVISFEKLARWHALMVLVGGVHTDYHHNQLYYFDPSTGLLEPVVSDINGHGLLLFPSPRQRISKQYRPQANLPINEKMQPLLDVALRDPRFHHRRNQILYEAIQGVGSVDAQKNALENIFRLIDTDVRSDRNKASIRETFAGWFRVPYSNRLYQDSKTVLYDWIERRNGFIGQELARTLVTVTVEKQKEEMCRFVVQVDGQAAARFDPTVLEVDVHPDTHFDGRYRSSIETAILLSPGLKTSQDTSYMRGRRVPDYALVPSTQYYVFRAKIDNSETLKDRLQQAFTHVLDGRALKPSLNITDQLNPQALDYSDVGLHLWRLPKPALGQIVLGPGTVELKESVVIGPEETLVIRPGTQLKLAEGVSLASQGKVLIEGTETQPVVIERLNRNKPWGAIIIHGPNSQGSKIRHAIITGGSLDTVFNVAYSGMVSVHWSDGFVIQNTIISKNVLSDDTLHIIHGSFIIDQLILEDCFGDCIDFDYAEGVLNEVRVTRAGNDGIDFMSSQITATGIKIDGAGDKGISAGEQSLLNFKVVDIRRAQTAIAAKDRSQVEVVEGVFADNNIAMNVYRKNWRYGGTGEISLQAVSFLDNNVNILVEKDGKILMVGQPVPAKVVGEGSVTSNLDSAI